MDNVLINTKTYESGIVKCSEQTKLGIVGLA